MKLEQWIASTEALLELDAKGAIAPHGIGGHARSLLEDALERARSGKAMTDSVEEVSAVMASAERVASRYRINLDEAGLRAWASDAVKVIRALSRRAIANTGEGVDRLKAAYIEVTGSTMWPTDGQFARMLTLSALTSPPASALDLPAPTEAASWHTPIDSAPVACTLLASYFDVDVGEWIVQIFVADKPTAPFTHWQFVHSPDASTQPATPDHTISDSLREKMLRNGNEAAERFLATPAGGVEISDGETSLLAEMSKHVGWELDWGPKERNDEEGDYGWRLFERSGNRSDREWTLLGFGDTPLTALKSALEQGDGQ